MASASSALVLVGWDDSKCRPIYRRRRPGEGAPEAGKGPPDESSGRAGASLPPPPPPSCAGASLAARAVVGGRRKRPRRARNVSLSPPSTGWEGGDRGVGGVGVVEEGSVRRSDLASRLDPAPGPSEAEEVPRPNLLDVDGSLATGSATTGSVRKRRNGRGCYGHGARASAASRALLGTSAREAAARSAPTLDDYDDGVDAADADRGERGVKRKLGDETASTYEEASFAPTDRDEDNDSGNGSDDNDDNDNDSNDDGNNDDDDSDHEDVLDDSNSNAELSTARSAKLTDDDDDGVDAAVVDRGGRGAKRKLGDETASTNEEASRRVRFALADVDGDNDRRKGSDDNGDIDDKDRGDENNDNDNNDNDDVVDDSKSNDELSTARSTDEISNGDLRLDVISPPTPPDDAGRGNEVPDGGPVSSPALARGLGAAAGGSCAVEPLHDKLDCHGGENSSLPRSGDHRIEDPRKKRQETVNTLEYCRRQSTNDSNQARASPMSSPAKDPGNSPTSDGENILSPDLRERDIRLGEVLEPEFDDAFDDGLEPPAMSDRMKRSYGDAKPVWAGRKRAATAATAGGAGAVVVAWDDVRCRAVRRDVPPAEGRGVGGNVVADPASPTPSTSSGRGDLRSEGNEAHEYADRVAAGPAVRQRRAYASSFRRMGVGLSRAARDGMDDVASPSLPAPRPLAHRGGAADEKDAPRAADADGGAGNCTNDATKQTAVAGQDRGDGTNADRPSPIPWITSTLDVDNELEEIEYDGNAKLKQPHSGSALDYVRAFFRHLDESHTITVDCDSNAIPYAKTKVVRTERSVEESEYLAADYSEYRATVLDAGISPLSLHEFARNWNLYFAGKGTIRDGLLDED